MFHIKLLYKTVATKLLGCIPNFGAVIFHYQKFLQFMGRVVLTKGPNTLADPLYEHSSLLEDSNNEMTVYQRFEYNLLACFKFLLHRQGGEKHPVKRKQCIKSLYSQ